MNNKSLCKFKMIKSNQFYNYLNVNKNKSKIKLNVFL